MYKYPEMPDSVRAIEEDILYELSMAKSVPEVIELDSCRYNRLKQYVDECERYYSRVGGVPASAYGATRLVLCTPWGIVEIQEKKEIGL